jgi:hypothetical protein
MWLLVAFVCFGGNSFVAGCEWHTVESYKTKEECIAVLNDFNTGPGGTANTSKMGHDFVLARCRPK